MHCQYNYKSNIRTDCIHYHCEHDMGASIDCCTLRGLGDCPCTKDCSDYVDEAEVYRLGLEALKQPERKKGLWINKKPRWIASLSMTVHDAYECSNCGEPGVNWWKHCIYCGAPMEIEEWKKPIIERWRREK